jgi:prephenate dehydratase
MVLDAKLVNYYNATFDGNAAEGFKLLSVFGDAGVNLLGFKAIPVGSNLTRFTLFPDDGSKMENGAKKARLELDGPYSAIIVKGDSDDPGDCARAHERLAQAGVKVTESSGIADIRDSYGIIFYIDQEDSQKAIEALQK